VGSDDWGAEERSVYSEPPSDPRYRALAERILSEIEPLLRDFPGVRALAVQEWLSANSIYSRRAPSSGDDAIGAFLFGSRKGYCVHFAQAASLLYRTVGVPSRVAAGYAVPRKRRGDGSSLLIMSNDAHAWPEVYSRGSGWIPLDISAKRSEEPPPTDFDLQRHLGEVARQSPAIRRLEDQSGWQWIVSVWRILRTILLCVLLACVFGCYAWKLYRRSAPHWCAAPRLPVASYRATLDRLAEACRIRALGQSREAFALACGGPALARLTGLHLSAALGQRTGELGRDAWLVLSEAAAREAIRDCPRWRRVLGLLNPLSWLAVR